MRTSASLPERTLLVVDLHTEDNAMTFRYVQLQCVIQSESFIHHLTLGALLFLWKWCLVHVSFPARETLCVCVFVAEKAKC